MLTAWLESLLLKSAVDVESAGNAVFQFSASIRKILHEKPIQEWEAAFWARGLKTRLLKQEGHFFRAGTGKHSSLSFFVRNESGRSVGLRRESITQAATYVKLVTEYGYARSAVRFESQWMDVAVYDERGEACIYAETKASEKILEKLCRRLSEDFIEALPPLPGEGAVKDDALMKAHHLWRHKPGYFWGVAPTAAHVYAVSYGNFGFRLTARDELPAALEWESARSCYSA